jgi:hypothetical protein
MTKGYDPQNKFNLECLRLLDNSQRIGSLGCNSSLKNELTAESSKRSAIVEALGD